MWDIHVPCDILNTIFLTIAECAVRDWWSTPMQHIIIICNFCINSLRVYIVARRYAVFWFRCQKLCISHMVTFSIYLLHSIRHMLIVSFWFKCLHFSWLSLFSQNAKMPFLHGYKTHAVNYLYLLWSGIFFYSHYVIILVTERGYCGWFSNAVVEIWPFRGYRYHSSWVLLS